MKRFLLALICLLCITGGIVAAETQERVITLPQDQGKWYVSLFGDPQDDQFNDLLQWFETNKSLKGLRDQVHYNEYPSTSPRYQRYARSLPGTPCVRVQTSKGKVISEFWSDFIPRSGSALYRGITADMLRMEIPETSQRKRRGLLRRLCPLSKPSPEPEPEPEPEPVPVPLPPDTPPVIDQPPETQPGFPWLLALAAIAIGAGVGVGQGFKEEHLDSPTRSVPKVP